MLKLSCTPISFQTAFREKTMDLPGFIRRCSELGLDGIDLLDPATYPGFWPGGMTVADAARLTREEGLALAAWACSNNFALPGRADREAQADRVRRAIDHAALAGAPLLRIFGGSHRSAGGDPTATTAAGLRWIMEMLEKTLPHAERAGVTLALENHGCLPGHVFEMEAILDRLPSPHLRVTFDAANFLGNSMAEDEDPLRAWERLRERVAHVHLKDVGPPRINLERRREPYVAGRGITPLRQLVALLARDGYPGFGALEYEASLSTPEAEGVAASIAFLKECREAAALQRQPLLHS